MLLLALTSLRAASLHADLAQLVLEGDLPGALRRAGERIERLPADAASQRAALGQLLGRALLASGREEEAEELFQRQLKSYEALSRHMVRWYGSMDQAAMLLHLNRPARALECSGAVADDARAPVEARIEAMAATAVAMHRAGDWRSAMKSVDVARTLAGTLADGRFAQLVDCLALELSALHHERAGEALDDHALGGIFQESAAQLLDNTVLHQQLGAAALTVQAWSPLAAMRMRFLQGLLAKDRGAVDAAAHVGDAVAWLRERRMSEAETQARIEGAMTLIGSGAHRAATDLLAPLTFNEQQMRRSRYAVELQYCLAKLHQHQGRHIDALRLYRHHTQQAVQALRSYVAAGRTPVFLQLAKQVDAGDATKMRLPLRYRRAYQYMMEHLADEHLSVRQVAAHIGVTERALQLAFRAHLGVTPAELIRTRRVENIHQELQAQGAGAGVLEVASRWGVKNRSTLVHSYRSRFDETPTQTLRGAVDGAELPVA
ncbi:MAG TPA: helix-turn-helix transcriptional regulator [Roseateles sp.]